MYFEKSLAMSAKKNYNQKRNFSETPEPPATGKKKSKGEPIFVIQKHDASRLHYDFRLEIGGTLKSWAVPKGPSLDPKVKRMAVPVEDHPMAYASFEGVIPEGNYGAGTVMVWDFGTYENIKEVKGKKWSMKKCFEEGTIEIQLKGKKMNGGFALVRMKGGPMENNWLLIKMRDDAADEKKDILKTESRSAKTRRTMEEITRDESE